MQLFWIWIFVITVWKEDCICKNRFVWRGLTVCVRLLVVLLTNDLQRKESSVTVFVGGSVDCWCSLLYQLSSTSSCAAYKLQHSQTQTATVLVLYVNHVTCQQVVLGLTLKIIFHVIILLITYIFISLKLFKFFFFFFYMHMCELWVWWFF